MSAALSNQQKNDIEKLYKFRTHADFTEDMRQFAALEILSKNKPLSAAMGAAKCQLKRDEANAGITPPHWKKSEKLERKQRVELAKQRKDFKKGGLAPDFEYLDADPTEDDEKLSLHEVLAAPEPTKIALWRVADLDEVMEQTLKIMSLGGASIGRSMGLTPRRGQQKVVGFVEKMVSEEAVLCGAPGQFGLNFGGGK